MGENVDDYKLAMSPAVPNLNNDQDEEQEVEDDPNIPDLFVKGKFGRKVTTTTKTTTTKATTTTTPKATTSNGESGYLSSILPDVFSSRIGSIMPDVRVENVFI